CIRIAFITFCQLIIPDRLNMISEEDYEAHEAHRAMVARCRALMDDWQALRELGSEAEKYC
ncbi:MAG: hypothetical protein PHP89_06845, partial [Candidatus Omnitrophica bacterium]|nr:hypothetical protein [Candidatus Omnitrophota bacterium]